MRLKHLEMFKIIKKFSYTTDFPTEINYVRLLSTRGLICENFEQKRKLEY